MSSDIFDDIALNYLGRVVKAGDRIRIQYVHNNLHDYLTNKCRHITKRLINDHVQNYTNLPQCFDKMMSDKFRLSHKQNIHRRRHVVS